MSQKTSLTSVGFTSITESTGSGHIYGEIEDLRPALPISVLALRDPDNIQLELTAPTG